jgi:hypothetical protein
MHAHMVQLTSDIFRHIQPMAAHVSQLIKQKKYFQDGDMDEIGDDLRARKQAEPQRIPYMISPAAVRVGRLCASQQPSYIRIEQDQPGRYWLQYVLKVNVGKQRITIVPDGYRMCGQVFSHPDQLINWFKKNHRVSHADIALCLLASPPSATPRTFRERSKLL